MLFSAAQARGRYLSGLQLICPGTESFAAIPPDSAQQGDVQKKITGWYLCDAQDADVGA